MSEGKKAEEGNVTELAAHRAPVSPMEIAKAILETWLSQGYKEDEEFDLLEVASQEKLAKMIAMSLVGAYDSGVADGSAQLEQRLATMNFTQRSEMIRVLQDKWKKKDSSLYLGNNIG